MEVIRTSALIVWNWFVCLFGFGFIVDRVGITDMLVERVWQYRHKTVNDQNEVPKDNIPLSLPLLNV